MEIWDKTAVHKGSAFRRKLPKSINMTDKLLSWIEKYPNDLVAQYFSILSSHGGHRKRSHCVAYTARLSSGLESVHGNSSCLQPCLGLQGLLSTQCTVPNHSTGCSTQHGKLCWGNTCWILPESHYPFLLSNGIHFPFPEDWGRSGYPWPVEVSTGHELSQLVNLFPRPQGLGGAWPFISAIKWNSCLECWDKAIPPLLYTMCVEVRPPLCPVSHHDRSQEEEVNAWKRVQQVKGVQDPNSSKTSRWFQTWGLYGF